MLRFSQPHHYPLALALLSAAALIAAAILQYGFGFAPCELCLWQRWPYRAVILLGMLTLLIRPKARPQKRAWAALLLLGCLLAFLANSGIAGYHVAIEQGWVTGDTGCSGTISSTDASLDALREAIRGAPLVRCDEPAFMLFGLSLSAWNLLASLAFSALTILSLRAVNRNPKARAFDD